MTELASVKTEPESELVDCQLIANRYLDICGEIIRKHLKPLARKKFDSLSPTERRKFTERQIERGALTWN